MITHYLKIAFRNMRKYKNQTLVSVIGLSVGFTCFALAMLWIRYEMTFDSFHKNAGQMYVIYRPNSRNQTGSDFLTSFTYFVEYEFHHATLVGKLCKTDEYSGLDIFVDCICSGVGGCALCGVAGV